MTAWLRFAACGALALLPAVPQSGHDPARETPAGASVEVAPGRSLSLRWRTIAWSDAGTARMRSDPAVRKQGNERLPIALQSELVLPIAMNIGGRRLEPDTYRIGLWMDEAGAFDLSLLLDHEYVRFPLELAKSEVAFPYLAFSLLPAPEGGFALVFQWGDEYGRAVLVPAR